MLWNQGTQHLSWKGWLGVPTWSFLGPALSATFVLKGDGCLADGPAVFPALRVVAGKPVCFNDYSLTQILSTKERKALWLRDFFLTVGVAISRFLGAR